jgi:cell fate (sporulation/competence/biofilm development) regulator YlbF (YheA/YmcA/DUF963 family)
MVDYIIETKMFVDKLKKTDEYSHYGICKNSIKSNPQLLDRLNEYRKKSFEIYSSNEDSYEVYENTVKLNNHYNELLNEPKIKEFLDAEIELSRIISSIYNCIATEIDIDIEFLK